MRLADYVTLNFNYSISTAAVFLDIGNAFDTTWHSGLLYKSSELESSTSLIRLIASFLTERKLKVFVEGEFSKTEGIAADVPQGSVLLPRQLKLFLLCSHTIPVFTGLRYMNVLHSGNCNTDSLQ
jgi:hypothetical protein